MLQISYMFYLYEAWVLDSACLYFWFKHSFKEPDSLISSTLRDAMISMKRNGDVQSSKPMIVQSDSWYPSVQQNDEKK